MIIEDEFGKAISLESAIKRSIDGGRYVQGELEVVKADLSVLQDKFTALMLILAAREDDKLSLTITEVGRVVGSQFTVTLS